MMKTKTKTKTKTNKWDLVEVKSLCTGKHTHTHTHKMITEWEKILANDVTNKGLVSEIYKQFMQLNIRKQNKTHTTKKQKN